MVAVLFVTFVVCLALGVPVAFSLGISSLAYFIGSGMSLYMFAQRFFAGLNSFTLLCIPGFVFAGTLMNQGGITERLIGFCNKIVGHITGGLAIANVVASMLFAGISGTALADTVSIGGILILFPVLLNLVLQVGVDPIQFGVMVVLNLVLGLCTPPVGVCLFAATNIGETKLTGVIHDMIPYLISNFTVLLLVTFIPGFTAGIATLILGAS